ncbi:MAG TPA: ABC transporter permease, partial [Vicinamibacterales bacterium]|nr:ABC transporter permease [Vicinamibacterales bacterium]
MNRPPRLWRALLRLSGHRGRRDELDADLAEAFERRVASIGPAEARRRYRRDVLSFYMPQRRGDDAWRRDRPIHTGDSMFNSLLFDVRQAAHAVRRQPAFFAVAILTLAVGLGAQFSAFGVVDRLLLAPPAHVQDAGRVFRLHIDREDRRAGRFLWFQTPYRSYLDLRGNVPGIAAMAAYRSVTASVGSGSEARQASVIFADHHYFPLLGVKAQVGRAFGAEDDQPPGGREVVVLSDAYWRGAFGSDPNVLGRDLRIGAKTYRVIGVMPPGFTGDLPEPVDAWIPLHAGAYEMNPLWTSSFLFRSVSVLTRLAEDARHAAAAEAAATVYRRTVDGTPAADPTAKVLLSPLSPGRTQQGTLTQAARIAVWIQGV